MKILFVTLHDITGKATNGGDQCSHRNLTVLQTLYGKENVDICVGELMRGRVRKLLAGLRLRSDLTMNAERQIYSLASQNHYDLIFFDSTRLGRVAKKIKVNLQKKIVVFAHNVEKDILWQRVINENILCISLYWAAKHCEALSLKYGDIIIALGERDSNTFQKVYHRKVDYLFPITFSDTYTFEESEQVLPERSLLFAGSSYLPNQKGIIWFCKEVMPYLDIPLYIVGRGMENLKSQLENDRIYVIGSVEDISAYFRSTGAVVMPIFYGSGMKVKTAEAIMYGKRIFATTEALEGYQMAKSGISRCDNAESFRKEIKHYFDEEGIQKEIQEVRALFEQYYDTNQYLDSVKKLLEGNYES